MTKVLQCELINKRVAHLGLYSPSRKWEMDRIYSARHLLGGPQGRERRHAELSLERSAENFTYRKFRTVIKYFKNPIFKTVIFKILF